MPETTDIITGFLELTESSISPELFRKWAAITLVAATCERRIWLRTGPRITFGNMYTLLVAPPGVGKLIIDDVKDMWEKITEPGRQGPALHTAPDSMTKASLVDSIAASGSTRLIPNGPPYQYHSLAIAAEEFAVMMPAYDLEYIGTLNKLYMNPSIHKERRRTGSVTDLEIKNPQLNILGGAQPGWLASVFPEEAWSTGLTSRMLMIYSASSPFVELFAFPPDNEEKRQKLLSRLGAITQIYGELGWHQEAADAIADWHRAGGPAGNGPDKPVHSKLEHYCRRRTLHVLKLCLVSCVSRGDTQLKKVDVARATGWLLEAEQLMPDIFRAMLGKSDTQVMEELHYYLTGVWRFKNQQPVPGPLLYDFLRQRVPTEKIPRIIDVMERADLISRVAGEDTYVPRPKLVMKVE